MKKNRNKSISLILLILITISILFYFWYTNIYNLDSTEPIKSIISNNKEEKRALSFPNKINDYYIHIPWGIPKLKNEIYKLNSSPEMSNIVLKKYKGYACGYNRNKKISDWVSYYIKKEYLYKKKILKKKKFKPAPSIKKEFSARLLDYKRSGYDRGHLARQADMYGRSLECELEACYLTNIAPQKPEFNRKIWLNIENLVQKWAKKYEDLYIVTGPIYDENKTFLKKRKKN